MNLPHAFNAHAQPPVWDWIAYRSEHAAELDALKTGAAKSDITIGLQSAYTTDFIQQVLEAKLLFYGRRPIVTAGGFNQYRQELLDPKSAHFAAKPDATVLLLDPRWSWGHSVSLSVSIQEIRQIARVHAETLPAGQLIVSNFFQTMSSAEDVHDRNVQIQNLTKEFPRTKTLDMDRWVAAWGWQKVIDPKHEFLAGMLIAPEMVPYLAEEILAFLYEPMGLRKKCLVLDLDDTLWGGIVGEAGADGIQLDATPPGNVYRAIQQTALALQKKGALLAVASKNNPKDALDVIDGHPMMVLRRSNFADIQIGWHPKDRMIREIAKNLNIGVDSLVFLDDNPVERDLVRQMLPGVLVLDLPADPAWWPRYIEGLRCFEAAALTAEDQNRARMYEEEKKRKEIQESAGTLDDYFRTLETVVTIGELSGETDPHLARIAQLSQRTNQFNLTTRRYTEGQLVTIRQTGSRVSASGAPRQRAGVSGSAALRPQVPASPTPADAGRIFWMKVCDRFGDSGLVGVAVVAGAHKGQAGSIDNFLMSCRVIGRGVERVFIQSILTTLKSSGVKEVTAEYIPSEKNMQTKDFYPTTGFAIEQNDSKSTRYRLALDSYAPADVPHVTVVRE